MKQFLEFFPEHADNPLHPAAASVQPEPSLVTFLNRQKIHGLAMGDGTREVVNLGQS